RQPRSDGISLRLIARTREHQRRLPLLARCLTSFCLPRKIMSLAFFAKIFFTYETPHVRGHKNRWQAVSRCRWPKTQDRTDTGRHWARNLPRPGSVGGRRRPTQDWYSLRFRRRGQGYRSCTRPPPQGQDFQDAPSQALPEAPGPSSKLYRSAYRGHLGLIFTR